MTTRFFNNPKTAKELRSQYVQLMKQHHPDNGGSEEDCKAINAEYSELFKVLKDAAQASGEMDETPGKCYEYDFEADEAMRAAVYKILHLDGINIEICGVWAWVTGNTYPVKDAIKAAGFRFSRNKAAWYFHSGEYHGKRSKCSLDDIRAKYGSVDVEGKKQAKIA